MPTAISIVGPKLFGPLGATPLDRSGSRSGLVSGFWFMWILLRPEKVAGGCAFFKRFG